MRIDRAFLSSIVAFAALVAVGFAVFAATWRGAARHWRVDEQVAVVVSGGFGGLALVACCVGVLLVQQRRVAEAGRRAEMGRVIEAAGELLDAVRRERGGR